MHSRRSLLYVPGSDRHKIEKTLTLQVDSIALDLEDGVALSRKAEARGCVAASLQDLDFGASEKLVRINPVGSGLEMDDLDAVLFFHPDGIVLSKVETLDQVRWAADRIEAMELASGWVLGSLRLIADVEIARGIINLKEIASHPRLDALIFGAEDYAVSIGAVRTPVAWEVFTARSLVVLHARASGLQAIDMVNVDYRDLENLRREAVFGAQMGYTGKQVIHPAQVLPVQEAFTPDEAAVASALRLVDAFELHQQEGRGAFGLDGRMIDMPLVKAARGVLDRARAAGKL